MNAELTPTPCAFLVPQEASLRFAPAGKDHSSLPLRGGMPEMAFHSEIAEDEYQNVHEEVPGLSPLSLMQQSFANLHK